MKFLFITVFLVVGLGSTAQNATNVTVDNYEFSCENVIYNSENNEVVMLGNVSFKTDIIELENADKVVYRNNTDEIIVTTLRQFKFDGTIEVANSTENKKLRYKIGERIAYIE